jgi:hypothetical protein
MPVTEITPAGNPATITLSCTVTRGYINMSCSESCFDAAKTGFIFPDGGIYGSGLLCGGTGPNVGLAVLPNTYTLSSPHGSLTFLSEVNNPGSGNVVGSATIKVQNGATVTTRLTCRPRIIEDENSSYCLYNKPYAYIGAVGVEHGMADQLLPSSGITVITFNDSNLLRIEITPVSSAGGSPAVITASGQTYNFIAGFAYNIKAICVNP